MYCNIVFYLFLVPFCRVTAEGSPEVNNIDEIVNEQQLNNKINMNSSPIARAIDEFIISAKTTIKEIEKDDLPEEEKTKLLNVMLPPLKHIIDLLKDPANVYQFIEGKGMDQVILPYLHLDHYDLRTQLLKLTQLLFDVAPGTTSVLIPVKILDKLLDVFEEDQDMVIKARTLYILYTWLPENPKVQARVRKLKSMEPLLDQIPKQDAKVINMQLKLLSRTIKEQIDRKKDDEGNTDIDSAKLNFYKKIVLIEKLPVESLCHGLFYMFNLIWKHSKENKDYMVPVFDILMDVQPYCIKSLSTMTEKTEILAMFIDMYHHLKNMEESAKNEYQLMGINNGMLKEILWKYITLMESPKDEL